MKRLFGLLLSLVFLFSSPTTSLANCTFAGTAPTCNAVTAGTQWCDTGVDGSATDPVLKGCDGTSWLQLQQTVNNRNITLGADVSLTNSGITGVNFGTDVDNTGAEVNQCFFFNRGSTSANDPAFKWNTATGTFDFVNNCSGSTLISARVQDTPTDGDSAVNKDYVTSFPDGFTIGAGETLDFGANRLRNVASPTTSNDAARKDYVDTLEGGLMVGVSTSLDFGANKLTNIGTPTASTDATTKAYVDSTASDAVASVFGDGSDGDIDINSTSFSSGPITNNTLTRDAFFDDLTLSGGDLKPNGYRIFVKGTLTIDSGFKIHANGGNGNGGENGITSGGNPTNGGAGGAGGAAGSTDGSIPGGLAGANGGGGGSAQAGADGGNGGAGGNGTNATNSLTGIDGSAGGAGGNGGVASGGGFAAGNGGATGAAGTATLLTAADGGIRNQTNAVQWTLFNDTTVVRPKGSASSGSGAGGGGAAGIGGISNCGGGTGGGGGGAGGNGGNILIAVLKLVNNGSIEAKGGSGDNGGNGGNADTNCVTGGGGGGGGGGTGGGGNGGIIITIASVRSGSGTISVSGGTKGTTAGTGGAGFQGGVNGSAGSTAGVTDGSDGLIIQL